MPFAVSHSVRSAGTGGFEAYGTLYALDAVSDVPYGSDGKCLWTAPFEKGAVCKWLER
ncbi:hypothetical protein ACR6HW_04165 [Fusibacter sp. JL298sf-3]